MKRDENVILSPLSISMALAMLQQGTSGNTEKDIGATVFNGLPKDIVARKFKLLREVPFYWNYCKRPHLPMK